MNPKPTFSFVCVLCVCVLCGVPWMDQMLWSLITRQLDIHNQYMCTHSPWHNIVLNRAGILAWVSTLHGSPTMDISWRAFFVSCYLCMYFILSHLEILWEYLKHELYDLLVLESSWYLGSLKILWGWILINCHNYCFQNENKFLIEYLGLIYSLNLPLIETSFLLALRANLLATST